MNIIQLLQSITQNKNNGMLNPIVNPAYTQEERNKPVNTPKPTPAPVSKNGQMYGRNPDTVNANPDITNAIKQATQKFNIPTALLFDIAMAENSLQTSGKSTDPRSTATGAFQFNDPTWETVLNYARNPEMSLYGVLPNEDRNDPVTNALAAAYLIKFGQLGRWDASKGNWGKFWPDEELNKLGLYNQSK